MENVTCAKCKRETPRNRAVVTKAKRSLWCRDCHRAVVKNGIRGRQLESNKLTNGRNYLSRNLILRELGFASYRDYLASDLWRSVRAMVYAAKGRWCYLCGRAATELHHNRYHKNDLTGKRLKFINPICRGCHESIEFRGDEKATLHQAKAAFRKQRKRYRHDGNLRGELP